MTTETNWLRDKIVYIKGPKTPSEQQLLVLLTEKPVRTSTDEKKLATIIRAENAAKARIAATALIQAEKRAAALAERKPVPMSCASQLA